ncbi:MAG: peptidyl-prolyl cis-trans isomerase [Spirochaetes bacterium]|nr:peptidyl-prolyl cis-trans isomerase [Spirochaetota bacterium]
MATYSDNNNDDIEDKSKQKTTLKAKSSQIKKTKSDKKSHKGIKNANILVILVTALIIISFTFYDSPTRSGPIDGLKDFINNFKKARIINEDGSITIPEDAPTEANKDNPNTYIGKVLDEKITFGKNDLFNQNFAYIYENKQMNPFDKYRYTRSIFDETINRIIAIYNAKKVGIKISDTYKVQEIGKRYYPDKDGDINFKAMKQDKSRVESLGEDVIKSLLYENYLRDSFQGLPLSNKELWDYYVLDNVSVTLNYINISNYNVSDTKLSSYFEDNKKDYVQYKITKIVFDSSKNMEAEEALNEIKKDKIKFKEIGNSLNNEKKIINMVSDTEFQYLNNFKDLELIDELRGKKIGDIGSKPVKTEIGLVLFIVDDVKNPIFSDQSIKNLAKDDYLKKYYTDIENENKTLADKFYNYAKQTNIESASKAFGLKLETSRPTLFLDTFPNMSDTTDDKNFIVKIFSSKPNQVLVPYKHSSGFMICAIKEKKDILTQDFIDKFDGYAKRYTTRKEQILESDFFQAERKKYEIVDNFNLVINYQTFMSREDEKKE